MGVDTNLSAKDLYNKTAKMLDKYPTGKPILMNPVDIKHLSDAVRHVNHLYGADTIKCVPGGIELHNGKEFQLFDRAMVSDMYTGLKQAELQGVVRDTNQTKLNADKASIRQRVSRIADEIRAKPVSPSEAFKDTPLDRRLLLTTEYAK